MLKNSGSSLLLDAGGPHFPAFFQDLVTYSVQCFVGRYKALLGLNTQLPRWHSPKTFIPLGPGESMTLRSHPVSTTSAWWTYGLRHRYIQLFKPLRLRIWSFFWQHNLIYQLTHLLAPIPIFPIQRHHYYEAIGNISIHIFEKFPK